MKVKISMIVLLFATFGMLHIEAQETHSVEALKSLTLQDEKDNILALVAADYVYQDWQETGNAPRGYNIGAVLYDALADTIIGVNRNSIYKENDKTQHAEVGLMQGYFHGHFCSTPHKTLKGMHIITTLEPCMMCSGMMIFLEADTVKYVQTDPEFGKNIERLAQDWIDGEGNAHLANDRCTRIKSVSLEGKSYLAAFLNRGYEYYRKKNPNKSMTEYLQTPNARQIYKSADRLLREWQPIYPENQKLLDNARKVLGLPVPAKKNSYMVKTNYELFRKLWHSIE